MTDNTPIPVPNTVAWFQIGTDEPEAAKEFYGGLFGWTFAPEPTAEGYDLVTYAGAEESSGGIIRTAGGAENHAKFLVLVEDVAAVCARTEQLGGKILNPPAKTSGGLAFADLLDRSGNRFGVFALPAD
jgi:predicted enzyme related to lactoylglutathione lyase